MHSKNVDFVFIIILNDYYDRKQKNYLYCLLKHSIFFYLRQLDTFCLNILKRKTKCTLWKLFQWSYLFCKPFRTIGAFNCKFCEATWLIFIFTKNVNILAVLMVTDKVAYCNTVCHKRTGRTSRKRILKITVFQHLDFIPFDYKEGTR